MIGSGFLLLGALVWTSPSQTYLAKASDTEHTFTFEVKNTGRQPEVIIDIVPSCGCTVAQLPGKPWVIAPGATGQARATIKFGGRTGRLHKVLDVTSGGEPSVPGRLEIVVNIPAEVAADPRMDAARRQNQASARANRQVVFQGDCASCHVTPGQGKRGADLFQFDCLICHGAERRASMVPDLATLPPHRDPGYWRELISRGKANTLMPAFGKDEGGPLDHDQIESLVEFLTAGH